MNGVYMRTNIIVYILLVLSLVLITTSACAGKPVQVAPESVNFGDVEQGDVAIARFQLHNAGTQALTIQWMEFSKPGLVAQVNPNLAAGSSIEILVNWNTSDFTGDIEGQVTLGLDDPQNPEVVLTITGTVTPATDVPPEPEN